jgi:hypothetical protein
MDSPLLATTHHLLLLYAFPLIVAVSLVYAATRHEQAGPILMHALRIGLWIVGFMAVILVVLLLVSWWL